MCSAPFSSAGGAGLAPLPCWEGTLVADLTYDDRMAAAADSMGFTVTPPGRFDQVLQWKRRGGRPAHPG